MSKKMYIGDVNNNARKVKKIYIGVDNKARKVKKIYIGDANGKARLGYSSGASAYITAGSKNSGMRISYDGKTWSTVTDTSTYEISQIAYGNGVYVAASRDGYLAYSTDGITWTYQEMGSAVYGVAYGNNIFMAVGYSGAVYTSPDGITWTTMPRWTTSSYTGVLYGNGKFLAWVGTSLYYSTNNGESWTYSSAPSTTNFSLNSIRFANGKFYALYKYNNNEINYRIYESPDAVTWEEIRYGSDSVVPKAVAYGKGVTVFAGINGTALVYSDMNASPKEVQISENVDFKCYDLIYSGDKFVAVGYGNYGDNLSSICYSLDGYNWVTVPDTKNRLFYTVCKGTD